jgi:hypothetical protein
MDKAFPKADFLPSSLIDFSLDYHEGQKSIRPRPENIIRTDRKEA